MKQAADAKLILLSGNHIEHYLDKVQQATGGKRESLTVGDALPNFKMRADPDEPAEKAEADPGYGIVSKLLRPRHLHEASLVRWKRQDRA